MRVQEIHALVHPGFDTKIRQSGSIHTPDDDKTLVYLDKLWTRHLAAVSNNPDTFLIYLSIRNAKELETATENLPQYLQDDEMRIERLRAKFQQRLLVLPFISPYEEFSNLQEVYDLTGEKDFSNTKLYAFGEYYNICVKTFGKLIQDRLQISTTNFHRIPHLSLETNGQIAR